jgi:hypothetical protein
MLVPVNRKKFEELVPLVATGAQYKYCWGKFQDFLRRILVSIAALATILLVRWLLPIEELRGISFFIGLFALVYWLWSPVLQASLRNFTLRRYKFAGFLRGEVLDLYITDEIVSTEENVNDRGDLVIVENRERRINLEVGDESGFTTRIQVPLKKEHQAIRIGDIAELLVLSNRPDLSRIAKVSDIFLSRIGIWVSDYPYLRRDEFAAVSRELDAVDYADGYEDDRNRDDDQYEVQGRRRARYDLDRQDDFEDDDFEERPPRRLDAYSDDRDRSGKRIPRTGAVNPNRRPRRRN